MAAHWLPLVFCAGLASAACVENDTCPEVDPPSVHLLQRGLHFTQVKSKTKLQMCGMRPSHERRLSLAALRSVSSGNPRAPDAQQRALQCVQLGSKIHRDSREEVADIFRSLDALQAGALEAAPVQKVAATTCIEATKAQVTFNRPLTLLMNRTTHTMEHILALLRLYPDDAKLNERHLQDIAGAASAVCPELTPFVASAGGFDILFSALDRFSDNPDVMMSAWRGLSDHSHNAFGAQIIADHGGKMQGIKWMVDQMRIHPEPGLAESPFDHLSLKYEIMQNVNGILEHDAKNKYGRALLKEGFHEQLLYSMRVEPELRGTQDVACNCMLRLVQRNASAAKIFADAGAIKLSVDAVKRFINLRDSTPWCGTTLETAYSVVPTCSIAMMLFARANPASMDEMLELGLLDALKSIQGRPIMTLATAPLRVILASRAEMRGSPSAR